MKRAAPCAGLAVPPAAGPTLLAPARASPSHPALCRSPSMTAQEPVLKHVAVKEAVLPFDKFAGADTLLGPEMRSTGEVRSLACLRR